MDGRGGASNSRSGKLCIGNQDSCEKQGGKRDGLKGVTPFRYVKSDFLQIRTDRNTFTGLVTSQKGI